ncbi:putative cytochrome P450 oxidoreductase [Fistulina hepatica ATCC 64428]|uniref:Putative cytochrome P450 oxidoreductase n=1 Tax=Fistulina hepatica ATCC 64428 TaxID=1128425 RepID=A0A0D7APN3_9AGAR|nr:putative cytochrome P450 oxidoreductase [Fistulina hepatica ATCC 64428]
MSLLVVFVIVTVLIAGFIKRRRTSSLLPPGPPRKFIVGNLFDLPSADSHLHEYFATFHALYGPISSISVLGQHTVVLNDHQCASDLLLKRAAIYSDRPPMVFAKLAGWGIFFSIWNFGPDLSEVRKSIFKTIGTRSALRQYLPLQEDNSRRMLIDIFKTPDKTQEHVRKMVGATTLGIAYGYSVSRNVHDPLVDLAETGMRLATIAGMPGRWMCDVIPLLRFVPEWFPAAGFQKVARYHRNVAQRFLQLPCTFVQQQIEKGVAKPSYTTDFLRDKPTSPRDEAILQTGGSTIYAAGSDTSAGWIHNFLQLMSRHPDIQQKAQMELDRIVGSSRLPCYNDCSDLPYTTAVVREALRIKPIAPIGVPHMSIKDEYYRGYLIPKGTTMVANLSQISRDTAVYTDPDTFKPERFLGEHPEPLPDFVFGYGHRVCPGKELAYQTALIACSMILSVFKVEPSACVVPEEWTPGIAISLKKLSCTLTPRSAEAVDLILSFDDTEYQSDEEALLSCEEMLSKSGSI